MAKPEKMAPAIPDTVKVANPFLGTPGLDAKISGRIPAKCIEFVLQFKKLNFESKIPC